MDTNQTQTQDNAQGLAGMARNAAGEARAKAGEQLKTSVDSGRSKAADTLRDVARTLQASDMDAGGVAPYLNRAGEQVQRAADYLQNADLDDMRTQTEAFARRQPALFIGGAFVLGIMAARFLKSGHENGSRTDSNDSFEFGARTREGVQLDRERSLASYREPTAYSNESSTGSQSLGYVPDARVE